MTASINLADPRLGAAVLSASDEFFGAKERLLQPGEPQWREGVYDDHGKWMDGWETRRRRDGGHDHCLIGLASPAHIERVEIDTRYFTGNYPPYVSIDACRLDRGAGGGASPQALAAMDWEELLPRVALKGDQRAQFEIAPARLWTHLRLHLYPDGGIARLRVYGRPHRDWTHERGPLDLAAALNGGVAIRCSDEHYGAMNNLLLPGRGTSMADGWETRRRREPGFDWVIVRLGAPGVLQAVEVDTAYFKGNFPHQVSLQAGVAAEGATASDPISQSLYWPTLLEPQYLEGDRIHRFESTLVRAVGAIHYVRMNIHPDGGVSRLRLFGVPAVCAGR